MKRAIVLLCSLVLLLTHALSQQTVSLEFTDSDTIPSLPRASSWSLRISGLVQTGGDNWTLWYNYEGSSSTRLDDHLGMNGIQGFSLGIDIAAEYRVTDRFVLGVAVGYIPTK